MKCPECGQWNRASMPHCIKCGAPLNIDEVSRLQWKDTLKDSGPSTAYLRADEFGQVDSTPDARDQLAGAPCGSAGYSGACPAGVTQ